MRDLQKIACGRYLPGVPEGNRGLGGQEELDRRDHEYEQSCNSVNGFVGYGFQFLPSSCREFLRFPAGVLTDRQREFIVIGFRKEISRVRRPGSSLNGLALHCTHCDKTAQNYEKKSPQAIVAIVR